MSKQKDPATIDSEPFPRIPPPKKEVKAYVVSDTANGEEYWVAAIDTDDALDQVAEEYGLDLSDLELQCTVETLDGDAELKIGFESYERCGEYDERTQTARQWIEEVGRGVFGSTHL